MRRRFFPDLVDVDYRDVQLIVGGAGERVELVEALVAAHHVAGALVERERRDQPVLLEPCAEFTLRRFRQYPGIVRCRLELRPVHLHDLERLKPRA